MKEERPVLSGEPLLQAAEALLLDLYIDAPGAGLRDEDRKKAIEVAALCGRVAARLPAGKRKRTIVDLACGQGYAGIALARLLGPNTSLVGVEREPARVERCRAIAARLGLDARFERGEVADVTLPERPAAVVALHACGAATDAAIARATSLRATFVFVVPCCHARLPADPPAAFASHGVLRRRWDVLTTDARRVLTLEAAGYEVTVAELVPPSVTPDNLLMDARWIGPSARAHRAQQTLQDHGR